MGFQTTNQRNVTIEFLGWKDEQSSIKEFLLTVYSMRNNGNLMIQTAVIQNKTFEYEKNETTAMINLPEKFGLYQIELDVLDIAGNVAQARRFVLYDNESEIHINPEYPIFVQSAKQDDNFTYQIQNSHFLLNWTGHFYNSKMIASNLLYPIQKNSGNFPGKRDHIEGDLNVNGTLNVNGIVKFQYKIYTYKGESKKYQPHLLCNWTDIPDFPNQLMNVTLSHGIDNGNNYIFYIKAIDFMRNEVIDFIEIQTDNTKPNILNAELHFQEFTTVFVHNSLDLSKMNLTFKSQDPQTGLHTVRWLLGTDKHLDDIGSGSLPVKKEQQILNKTCPTSLEHCYCPIIGFCEQDFYTINLNKIKTADNHNGKHNRRYFFTLLIDNMAKELTTKYIEIYVDASPPQIGHAFDSLLNTPDLKYTNNPPDIMDYTETEKSNEFQRVHLGLSHESKFYIFIRVTLVNGAFTLKKIGPVYIDETPTISSEIDLQMIDKKLRVTWDDFKEDVSEIWKYIIFAKMENSKQFLQKPLIYKPILSTCLNFSKNCYEFDMSKELEKNQYPYLKFTVRLTGQSKSGYKHTREIMKKFIKETYQSNFKIYEYSKNSVKQDLEVISSSDILCVGWYGAHLPKNNNTIHLSLIVQNLTKVTSILSLIIGEYCFEEEKLMENNIYRVNARIPNFSNDIVFKSNGVKTIDSNIKDAPITIGKALMINNEKQCISALINFPELSNPEYYSGIILWKNFYLSNWQKTKDSKNLTLCSPSLSNDNEYQIAVRAYNKGIYSRVIKSNLFIYKLQNPIEPTVLRLNMLCLEYTTVEPFDYVWIFYF